MRPFTINGCRAGTVYVSNVLEQQIPGYTVKAGKTIIVLPQSIKAGVYAGRFIADDNKQQNIARISYQP